MAAKVQAIPSGYHSVNLYLVVRDGARAIDFYKQSFGASELSRMGTPDGKIAHAELKIGDSVIMLSDEMMEYKSPQSLGGSPVSIFLYVEDVDSVFNRAVQAGAKSDMPPADMFWGDRYGKLADPFGHLWGIATHIEDVAPAEMEKRAKEFMAKARPAGQAG